MRPFFFAFFLIGIIVFLPAFYARHDDTDLSEVPQLTATQYRNGLQQWEEALIKYVSTFEHWKTGLVKLEELQAAHLAARISYKRIELFMDYLDPQAVKMYINGAPLPSVDRHAPGINVLEPEGLQVLDEILFGPEEDLNISEMELLMAALATNAQNIHAYHKTIPFSHRGIVESIRIAAIRTFTLGVTGFDTPGSAAAIAEAQVSTTSMLEVLESYVHTNKGQEAAWDQRWKTIHQNAETIFATQADFNTFDRLQFLIKVTNPVLALITDIQKGLGIEFNDEVGNKPGPLNHRSKNMFSDDFLRVNYYSRLQADASAPAREKLGKLLFYDPVLSANNSMACASCHKPEKAFTDGLQKSLANDGFNHTLRNAPTLLNSVYAEHYFYDMREPFFERQSKHVIMDELEFASDFMAITEKLNQSPSYVALFEEAFPGQSKQPISSATVSQALSSYVASLQSWNSPFDRFVRGETVRIADDVKRGFNLFMGKAACGTCHFAPTFNGTVPPLYSESESEVLGVPIQWDTLNPILDEDPGRLRSGRPHDEAGFYHRSFKTVTVRNIALTGPYMHNGSFERLEDVLDFYNRGGGIGLGLDVPHQTLPDAPLELNEQDISDLVAFMHALTDTTGFTRRPSQLPAFPGKPEWQNRLEKIKP
jgi:cytochrome c peroxidase